MRPSYFLIRNQDYEFKPEKSNGWLNLGSILSNPLEPESLLEDYWIVPPQDYMEVKNATQENVKIGYEERRSQKSGIFTKFLESLSSPLGFNATHTHENVAANLVTLEKLETYFFTPTKPYLDKVLSTPAVRKYIREQLYCSCPYIVTGLRVARSGSGMDMNDRTKKCEFDISVDTGASFGAQGLLNVGPKVYYDKEVNWAKEYASSSDFVYAYRVAKIYFSVRQNTLKTRGIKGELFGVNEDFAQDYFDGDGAYTCEAKMQEDDEWCLAEGSFSEIDDEDGDTRLFIPL